MNAFHSSRKVMEKFSLKWNDFHSNVSKSFGLFRTEEYLHDVRLMTEDYHEVSAHRLVLSACSEYFRNIFRNSNRQDTLICLDGVTDEDLKNVLDYIYLGEAQICLDNLDRFLKVAERLKLEGLEAGEVRKYTPETESQQPFEVNEIKTSLKQDAAIIRYSHDSFEPHTSSKEILMAINLQISEYEERLEDGNARCTLCNKVVPGNSTNFRNHVERNHMEGLSFECPHCDKTFRSRASLSNHRNRNHK